MISLASPPHRSQCLMYYVNPFLATNTERGHRRDTLNVPPLVKPGVHRLHRQEPPPLCEGHRQAGAALIRARGGLEQTLILSRHGWRDSSCLICTVTLLTGEVAAGDDLIGLIKHKLWANQQAL